jgi:hypothetical protein
MVWTRGRRSAIAGSGPTFRMRRSWALSWAPGELNLPRRRDGRSWAGRTVVLEERRDDSLWVRHDSEHYPVAEAPAAPTFLRTRALSRRAAELSDEEALSATRPTLHPTSDRADGDPHRTILGGAKLSRPR